MGSISDYLEDELLDHIFNGAGAAYTRPSVVYLGLSTADPEDDETGLAEPSGGAYVRKAITFGSAAASRAIANTAAVTFDQATGDWGTLTHFGIFDAETSGNMLAHGALETAKEVVSGNTPSVAIGEIAISFLDLATKADGHNISDYLANKLLDFVFRNQAFTQPATYIGYATANLADATTGANVTEVTGDGYARELVDVNGGDSPTWDLASGSVVDNTDNIENGPPTGSWGTVTAIFIVDADEDGNILFFDNNLEEQEPDDGDTVRVPAGDFDCSLS